MFCILMKKWNGSHQKKKIVGPNEITKSNAGWWGERAARGARAIWDGRGRAAPWAPQTRTLRDPTATNAGAGCSWVHPSGSSGQPVPQSRGSAQPDGCQQVFCHLSIAQMVLGRRNHVLGCTDQSCTSSPCPQLPAGTIWLTHRTVPRSGH